MTPLELGEKKKVTQSKVRWIGRLFQHINVLSQELPDAQGIVSRCIVVVKQPQFALPQLSSLLVHWAKEMPQDLSVDLLIDHLDLWQELTVDDNSHTEEWLTWLWRLTLNVLLSLASATSDSSTESSGAWFLGCTKKLMSHHQWLSSKQVWFILKMLNDVLTHMHALLLLIIIQQLWHHFCSDFPNTQIFGDNLPNTVLFHV